MYERNYGCGLRMMVFLIIGAIAFIAFTASEIAMGQGGN